MQNTQKKSSKNMPAQENKRITPFEIKLLAWGNREEKREGNYGILLEGEKLIEEALKANNPFEAIWYSRSFGAAKASLIKTLQQTCPRIREVHDRVLNKISNLNTPPGIVAVAPQPHFIFRTPSDPFSTIIVLSLVQDPGNLGGVMRTADYFGVDELWIGPGSADPYKSKVIRGSMGACFRLPVVRPPDLIEKIKSFQNENTEVYAAVAHDENAEISVKSSGQRIVIVGGESKGLDKELIKVADHSVKIPGAQRGESLNLAIASAILIYIATAGRWKGEVPQ